MRKHDHLDPLQPIRSNRHKYQTWIETLITFAGNANHTRGHAGARKRGPRESLVCHFPLPYHASHTNQGTRMKPSRIVCSAFCAAVSGLLVPHLKAQPAEAEA